ncbi:MAG: cation transporter [Hyphomicrobiaceae bacterium]
MMRALLLSLVLALPAASSAWAGERTVTLAVENMVCVLCPAAVRTAIRRVAGVKEVTVDFDRKIAIVVFDDTRTTAEKVAEASRLAGFPATRKE